MTMPDSNLIYRHGAMSRRQPPRRTPDKRTCFHCDGSGRNPKDPNKPCYVCEGKGEI